MRRLTHRAVDAAADLPLGSTSNRFRTRDALLVGVLGRILERETAIWTRLAIDIRTPTVDAVAGALGALLAELGSPDPVGDVHHLLALMDGLVINQLTSPRPDFDPTRAVTALLRGLIES